MKSKNCIIVSGPTAVGKTAYAIELAHKFNTEIVSADSRQCFKELNIGVAKPSPEQLKDVHHYFIDSHSIHEKVNAKVFEEYALRAVDTIFKNHDTAIIVGGTGLYLKAFMHGLDDLPEIDDELRNELRESYELNGITWLQQEIKQSDPLFFEKGEMQNPQRMLRALEVKKSTGQSILQYRSGNKTERGFEINNLLLEIPRDQLYERINHRVDLMIAEGLVAEAEKLFDYRHLNALQTVGYQEIFQYMEGRMSLPEAIDTIKKNTRQFAKRQMTWFIKYMQPFQIVNKPDLNFII
jgi:tRNA dimethylallyltransferase